jgi:hypothetical protein
VPLALAKGAGAISRQVMGMAVIGGHTEVSLEINRPIVVGCAMGIAEPGKYVTSGGSGTVTFADLGLVNTLGGPYAGIPAGTPVAMVAGSLVAADAAVSPFWRRARPPP